MSKKILYIVNHLKFHGGIERLISQKIDAWQELYGYEVSVIAMNQEGQPIIYPPKNEFSFTDLKLSRVNQYHPADLIKFVSNLRKIFKKENPDLIISTLTGLPSLLLPLIPSKGKKIMEIHSSGNALVSKSWKYKWWFLEKYDTVVLLNEDERQYYKLKNLKVIPNFIEIKDRQYPPFGHRRKRIVAAGRISPEKKYDHLIKAWAKIAPKFPDWEVEIYGDGDEVLRNGLNDLIRTEKLKRIRFSPATDSIMEIFKESSILALTSSTESFSLVLAEAKTVGLPVVSYDAPHGPRHIISNDGILVPLNDRDAFAEALSDLIKDEEKRKELSKNAWENRKQFSAEKVMKLWRDLLEDE